MKLEWGGGQGGGRPGEKGAGGVREAGEEGAGSGRKRKITQRCAIFRNRKNAKGRVPKNTGREPGLKGTGSGRFKPPCPPPPHTLECSGLSYFVRCLYSAAPMAFLCYLQFFWGENTNVLENPNGSL